MTYHRMWYLIIAGLTVCLLFLSGLCTAASPDWMVPGTEVTYYSATSFMDGGVPVPDSGASAPLMTLVVTSNDGYSVTGYEYLTDVASGTVTYATPATWTYVPGKPWLGDPYPVWIDPDVYLASPDVTNLGTNTYSAGGNNYDAVYTKAGLGQENNVIFDYYSGLVLHFSFDYVSEKGVFELLSYK